MADQAILEILIKVREELAGLTRTQQGIAKTTQQATSMGAELRRAFGIGSGIEITRRGIDLLTRSIRSLAIDAFRMAADIKHMSGALGISTEAYQVLKDIIEETGGSMQDFVQAANREKQALVDARNAKTSAAAALRTLRLEQTELEKLTMERRWEMYARAVANSTDKSAAYNALANLMGSRTLPRLMNALRAIARDGYDPLAESAKKSLEVIDEDAINRLEEARRIWRDIGQRATNVSAESLGGMGLYIQAFRDDPMGTLAAVARGPSSQYTAQFLSKYLKPKMQQPPPDEVITPLANLADWKSADMEITRDLLEKQVLEADQLLTEGERRQRLIPILERELAAREDLLRLAENRPLTEGENDEDRKKLVLKLQAEVAVLESQRRYEREKGAPVWGSVKWLDDIGDTSQLVSQTLQSTIGSTINTLSDDLWALTLRTKNWGDVWRDIGNIAGRALMEMIVKMTVVKWLSAALSWFLPGASTIGPTTSHGVAAAGGGMFVTRGPTRLTVGDNPGGVELVSVLPLSGVGRSTINGQALRMAGGGSALAAGALRGGDTFHFSYSFAGGVSREEVLAILPRMIQMSKAEVLDAQRRRRDGFR